MSEAHVYCQKRDLYGSYSDGSFFVPRRALQMRYIGLLRRPDFFVNNGSCLRFFGSWRLGCCLNRTSSQKPLYISKRCYFHRSACSLPSNGKLAHRAFLVLCGRCVNWPAFSLSSVCASCRASSCFDISGAGCASIPLPNSLSFSVILSVVRCCNKCYSWNSTSSFSHPLALCLFDELFESNEIGEGSMTLESEYRSQWPPW